MPVGKNTQWLTIFALHFPKYQVVLITGSGRHIAYLFVSRLQKMEVPPDSEEGAKPKMVHYYYINYQQFVNVVKYKLDQMRKKLESADKMVKCCRQYLVALLQLLLLCCVLQSQNRTSYKCSRCSKSFSDLDVDKLINLATGEMRYGCLNFTCIAIIGRC